VESIILTGKIIERQKDAEAAATFAEIIN